MPRKKGQLAKKKFVYQNTAITLKEFAKGYDIGANKLLSKQLQNGHLVTFYLDMSKNRKLASENFYSLVKNSDTLKEEIGRILNANHFMRKYISVINKYEYIVKRGNKNSKYCLQFLKQLFSISSDSSDTKNLKEENVPDISRSDDVKVMVSSAETDSKNNLYLPLLSELSAENENEIDIYERYFDLSSQNIDVESKNKKLSGLMEDAMSKLHDAELHNHKLKSALADLIEELEKKNKKIEELQNKLTNDSQRGNIVIGLTKQVKEKDDAILKLKFENKQLSEIVKKKDEYIIVMENQSNKKTADKTAVPSNIQKINKVYVGKPRGRRKKDSQPSGDADKATVSSLEKKVKKLVSESHNSKISELLLESFPDISISDFEVILKILTESNALLGQRIIHKWNVNGRDINFYGTIKENLKNQKKFYITYGKYPNKEEADTDFEVVDYTSIIADIIQRDLSFLDPCSLF